MWKADRAASCDVFSHQLGWELRLMIGAELVQSRVVRSEPDLDATATEWREALWVNGWTVVRDANTGTVVGEKS